MSNPFDTDLVATRTPILDLYGEAVIYYPSAGGSRNITAIVDRGNVQSLGGAPAGQGQVIEIDVANDATVGISSSEVNTGGDKVAVSKRIGEAAVSRRITRIISQDAGFIRLELR
jgi:hypothetical protein